MNKTGHRCILLVCALFLFLPTATMADDKETGVQEQRIIDTNKAAEQAHEVVAEVTAQHNRFLVTWLHLLDSADDAYASSAGVLTFAPKVPADLARVLRSTAVEGKSVSFISVLWRTILAIGVAYLLVRVVLAFYRKRLAQSVRAVPSEDDGVSRAWGGLLRNLPDVVALLLFGVLSTVIFLLVAGDVAIKGRMFFQAVLGTFLI